MSSLVGPDGKSPSSAPPSTIEIAQPAGGVPSAAEADVIRQMAEAWRSGNMAPAEHWLDAHPELRANSQSGVRIVYEEICLRQEQGEKVDSTEFYRRFPDWQSELEVLMDCHRLVEVERSEPLMPAVGEQFGEFQLISELGRGAAGRVFLARQHSLGDRSVVLKLSPRSGDEHLSLARLQHTNIVPLYGMQDFPEEHVRALCMPYYGGTTLADVLERLRSVPPMRRSGRQTVDEIVGPREATAQAGVSAPPLREATNGPYEAAAKAREPVAQATKVISPAARFLVKASYVDAACWIAACLADALRYAHERGLVHLDIKPSNILLADDGQPMLLDFHLAQEVIEAGTEVVQRLGGTRGYMSPEQLRAADSVRQGTAIEQTVDGRSDIYALGIVLYEMLAGRLPPDDDAARRRLLHERNPAVSRSLEDLMCKCLARDPAARYRDAGALAADLRRHLAWLPLRGVPNRSVRERWQKWRRRRPHGLALMSMGVGLLCITVSLAAMYLGSHARDARQALDLGQQQLEHHDHAAAIAQFEAGLRAISWLPGQRALKSSLENRLRYAKRAQLADSLHTLVVRLRYLAGFSEVSSRQLRDLDAGCEKIWEARQRILHEAGSSHEPLHRPLRTDLLDLALLWAELRLRLTQPEELAGARQRAADLLAEAESLCGKSPAVEFVRQRYKHPLAESDAPGTIAVDNSSTSVWEHDALGRALLHSDKLSEAKAQFDQALRLDPSAFWPNYYLAVCAYRLGNFPAALTAASVCVALSPESAQSFYNRGLAHQSLKQSKLALADYRRAIQLDAGLGPAAFEASKVLSGEGRHDDAAAMLRAALKHGADPAAGYYHLALVDIGRKDHWAALKDLAVALKFDPKYQPALALQSQLERTP